MPKANLSALINFSSNLQRRDCPCRNSSRDTKQASVAFSSSRALRLLSILFFCALAGFPAPTFSGRVIRLDADAMMRDADNLALATITNVEVERTACSRTTIVHLKATKLIKGHVELGKTYIFTYTTYPNPSGKSAEHSQCRRVHYYAPPRASEGKREVIAIIKDGAVVGTVDP